MPFLTEELWHGMGYAGPDESILRVPWPEAMDAAALARWGVRPEQVAYVDAKHDLIRVARTLRADYNLPPKREADFTVRAASEEAAAALERDRGSIAAMIRAGRLAFDPRFEPAGAMPGALSALGTVYLSLEGAVDVAAETAKLGTQLAKLDEDIARIGRKLGNPAFVTRAPPEVVAREEARRAAWREKREKIAGLLEALGG